MHVILDATAVQPPLSGVQRAVRNEVLAILRSPKRPDGLLLTADPCLEKAAAEAGYPCLKPPIGRSRLRRLLWQQLALPRILRREGADALHAFAYTAPLACRLPLILNVHDLIPFERPDLCSLRNRVHMRALMPRSIRQAERLIVSSSPVADSLVARFGVKPAQVTVAPLGVDARRFARQTAAPKGLPAVPFLLFVGNVEAKKGVDLLLEAWREIREATGLGLVVCGQAGWKCAAVLRSLRSLRGRADFLWLEDVPDAALPGLYQAAFASVLPSRIEGFGLPILEAMAAGTPVVHSDHPVLMETAGGFGSPFHCDDARDLRRALAELWAWDSRAREDRCAEARRYARACNWDRWAEAVYAS